MNAELNKQFYNYLGAYILVALSGCLGNVVDGIIVGNLISEDGVSAINLAKPINQFIFTLHLLINAGAGMLVAYALGQKNIGEARRFFSRALMLSTGIGVLLSIFGGVLFPDQTARMLCSNEHILPLARDYMQVLLLGNPAFIVMWGLSTMVGVDGKPKLVSAAVIIDNRSRFRSTDSPPLGNASSHRAPHWPLPPSRSPYYYCRPTPSYSPPSDARASLPLPSA